MKQDTLVVTFMNGPADGRQAVVHGPSITIGRGSDNDVVIDFAPGVADKHLEIVHRDGRWQLVDHSDGAGLLVKGERLHGCIPLVLDALVSLGDAMLRIGSVGA